MEKVLTYVNKEKVLIKTKRKVELYTYYSDIAKSLIS